MRGHLEYVVAVGIPVRRRPGDRKVTGQVAKTGEKSHRVVLVGFVDLLDVRLDNLAVLRQVNPHGLAVRDDSLGSGRVILPVELDRRDGSPDPFGPVVEGNLNSAIGPLQSIQ